MKSLTLAKQAAIVTLVIVALGWLATEIFFGGTHQVSGPPYCISNLKQVGLASLMYSNDYDDRLPLAANWGDSLMPYTKNKEIFRCPFVPNPTDFGYAYVDRLSNAKTTSFKNPEQQVMEFDSADLSWNAHSSGLNFPVPPRHSASNVCYLDSHVKLVK